MLLTGLRRSFFKSEKKINNNFVNSNFCGLSKNVSIKPRCST